MTTNFRLPPPWEPIELDADQEVEREFGPLTLSVRHRDGQWWIERAHEGVRLPSRPLPKSGDELVRFVEDASGKATLAFEPMLADRPIVARPEVPLAVVGGSRIQLLVSTPLWVRVRTGSGHKLADIPTVVLKDTWFGHDTRTGELCYAARTAARTRLEEAPRSQTRAITVVQVVNEMREPFAVTRVKIPTVHLPLYVDRAGSFFTPSIRIVHTGGGETGEEAITVVPPEAEGAVRVAAAREPIDRSLFRTFGGLLG